MTNRKPPAKPPHRARSAPQERVHITARGHAMLEELDEISGPAIAAERRLRAQEHDHSRVTPCAPKRAYNAPAPLPAHDAGTAGAAPAHPAGKSDAPAIVKPKEHR